MQILRQRQPGVLDVDWSLAEAAVAKLLHQAGRSEAEISVLLVDDAHIRALNRAWRGLDTATDVLSWPQESEAFPTLGDLPEEQPEVLGDVVISRDTALRQAAARSWSLEEEIALLLVHGVLHLLGFEDETEAGAEAMRREETTLLGKPLE